MSRDERLHIMMNVLRSRGAFGRDEMIDQLEISHPTFKRDLEFLRSRFQADIEYDASEKLYRLATADQLHGLAKKGNKVELAGLLQELGRRGINEVLAEAGTRLNGSLLREGCVDELLIYQAPMLLGDAARGMFGLAELADLAGAMRLNIIERRSVGADFRIRARLA